MKRNATEEEYRGPLLTVLRWLAGIVIKCSGRKPRLFAPLQADGWSAQPFAIGCRFTPAADLDPETGTPVGDEGYSLCLLNEAARWDYSSIKLLLFSIWQRPWGHSWLILESPQERLECGHTGDLGLSTPRYHDGAFQRIREGHPNPIASLWQTRSDGQFQIGRPNRPPTFVWRLPITRLKYQLIHDYVLQRKYDQFGVRSNNCTDMVIAAAALAGINLAHRIRLTAPPETKIWGRKRRIWTDPRYRIMDFSTSDVLETDLRHLTRLGIGSDVTESYLALQRFRSRWRPGVADGTEPTGELS